VMIFRQHLVRGSAKAFVSRTLTMFSMFNRSRERDLTRETIHYEYTYRDFDDAGTFVVTSGSSHARSGTPVALHCAHIFKGGEAPAGTSMVGIFFLLALPSCLSVFVIHIFRSEQTQRNLTDVYVFNGHGSSVRSSRFTVVPAVSWILSNTSVSPSTNNYATPDEWDIVFRASSLYKRTAA
jgi:hypothetical protein